MFYLSGVREGEVFWRIRVAVEEVVHVVVGQLFQLCLADISQEIHREIHPYTHTTDRGSIVRPSTITVIASPRRLGLWSHSE